MEINRLFYIISEGQIEAKDYVKWAYSMVENKYTSPALNTLAFLEEPLNIFEVEQFFKRVLEELNLDEPTYEEQRNGQIQYLLQQIILEKDYAIRNGSEIYKIYRNNFDYDHHKTLVWYEISEMIDDFQYGDNINNYSEELLVQTIIQKAKEQII